MPYSIFPLATCFTPAGLYMSLLISQFIPPSSPRPLSTPVRLFLPWRKFHLYHVSRFQIYVLASLVAQLVKNPPAVQEIWV